MARSSRTSKAREQAPPLNSGEADFFAGYAAIYILPPDDNKEPVVSQTWVKRERKMTPHVSEEHDMETRVRPVDGEEDGNNNNNNTFTWSGPSGVRDCTGQRPRGPAAEWY
jgi:hypothetical protein